MLARRRHLPHTVLIAHTYQMPLIYPSCQSVCICESTCPVILCVCSQRAAVQTVQPSLAQHRDPWATTPNCSLGITAALSPLSPHPFFLIPLSFPKAAPNSRSLTRSLSQAHTLVTSCYVSSWWKKCVMPRLMMSIITGGDNEVDLNLVWWLSCFGLKTGEGRLGHMCPLVAWRAPHSYCSLPLVPTIWLLNNMSSSFKFNFALKLIRFSFL